MTIRERSRGALFSRDPAFRLGWAFLLGAVGLCGWMVALSRAQRPTGLAHHVPLLETGMVALLVIALFAAAIAPQVMRRVAALFATATAAAIIWFLLVPFAEHIDAADIVFAAVVLPVAATTGVLLAVEAGRAPRRPGIGTFNHRAGLRVGTIVLGAPLVLVTGLFVAHGNPSDLSTDHLLLTWIGVDVVELVGVTGLGISLLRSPRLVAPFGALTAAILACDAWANVVASTQRSQLQAGTMALVEVPVAVLCLVLATRWGQPDRAAARRT